MQNLNTIPVAGKFLDVANKANTNFLAIKTAIEQLELSVIRSKGFFSSASALTSRYPSPVVGDWAVVQDASVSPATVYIWRCTTNGTWSNSGTEWPGGSIDLSEYALKTSLDSVISLLIEGGVREIKIDGTALVTKDASHGMYLQNGSIKRYSSNSYGRWSIPNNGYKHIRAYVGLNSNLVSGWDGMVFLCFRCGSDFVYNSGGGYIYSQNGGTFVKNGTNYTIANYNGSDYIYYSEDVATARKNSIIIDRDIPDGVDYIVVSTRNSAVTVTITLTKEEQVEGFGEAIDLLEKRIRELEDMEYPDYSGDISTLKSDASMLKIAEYAEHGLNLLDVIGFTNNKYITTSGSATGSASNCKSSDFIDVSFIEKAEYRLRRSTGSDIYTIAAFNENKELIPENSISGTASSAGVKEGTWVKAAGTKYVRCTVWKDDNGVQRFKATTSLSAIQEWIDNFKANYITGTEAGQYNLNGRTTALESALNSLSNDVNNLEYLNAEVEGGLALVITDGKTVASKSNHYYALQDDVVTVKNHGSWTRWTITNKDYETVKFKTYFNGDLGSGLSCVILLLFKVGSNFVFDSTKGYVQQGSYVYYPSCTFTKAQGSYWFYLAVDDNNEIEVPYGTTTIYLCARATSISNAEITLKKTATLNGLKNDVAELQAAIGIGGDEEGTTKNSSAINNDQDSLWLRNYLMTNHSYYFDAQGGNDTYDTQGYLDWKIANIPEGKHFIFITDGHWQDNPTRSTMTSTYVASYISKRLGGCPVFFGGDCINSATSKYLAAKEFSKYADMFYSAFGDTGFWVQGNHDSNKLGIDTANGIGVDQAIIEDTEIYKRSVARQAHKVIFDEVGIAAIQNIGLTAIELANATAWMKLHYHWDDALNKVRYIVYETGCTGWTWYKLCNTHTYTLPLLYPWVYRTLMSTPDNYDVVVLGHMFGGKTSSYTAYSSGNTDARVMMKLFRAFRVKGSISVNMRSYHTTGGTAFSRALCGTSTNRTFDFTPSKHKGNICIISGHWHNDNAFMCRYYENIDNVEGRNAVNVQLYNAANVTDDTVIHVNVACDTAASGRNNAYTSRPSSTGVTSECLFDVFTLTDDNKLVATRIGYGNDRAFLLRGISQEYDEEDEGGEGIEPDNPEEITNS